MNEKVLFIVLALGFIARSVIALSGDFVIHPDEIMQYLEPAHALVFDAGFLHFEQYYGARSWLIPGLVAGILAFSKLIGLDTPFFYIPLVKIFFCLFSMLIPYGMYVFARRNFGINAAIIALILGCFWYELLGFAHKPMSEFVATNLFMLLLASPLMSFQGKLETKYFSSLHLVFAAVLIVMVAAIRMQYAPIALILFAYIAFYKLNSNKDRSTFCFAAFCAFLAVGFFDYITWGNWFQSYIANIIYNAKLSLFYVDQSVSYQFLIWMNMAGFGLPILFLLLSWRKINRYKIPLIIIVTTVLLHSLQNHKEYRFIFVVIPLWLLIASDILSHYFIKLKKIPKAVLAIPIISIFISLVSILGILNALPYQHLVYKARLEEHYPVHFIRDQDPIFKAYKKLSIDPLVKGIWQVDRAFHYTPGYYYLHKKIPFYSKYNGFKHIKDQKNAPDYVTHLIAGRFKEVNGKKIIGGNYSEDTAHDNIEIIRIGNKEVREWKSYSVFIAYSLLHRMVKDTILPKMLPKKSYRKNEIMFKE